MLYVTFIFAIERGWQSLLKVIGKCNSHHVQYSAIPL